jgi:hypothetical protein
LSFGKLANFTILSDNPVTCDPLKIKDISVWGAVLEGRVLPGSQGLAFLHQLIHQTSKASTSNCHARQDKRGHRSIDRSLFSNPVSKG